MNFRNLVLGALGVALLTPAGLRAASFGDRAVPPGEARQLTDADAAAALAEWRSSSGRAESQMRATDGEPSGLLATFPTRAACEASIPGFKVETFDSSLFMSSAWGCGGTPVTSTFGGGCFAPGDITPGLAITEEPEIGIIFWTDGSLGWAPSDAVGSFTSSGRLNLSFTTPTDTVCIDVTHEDTSTATLPAISVNVFGTGGSPGGTLLGSVSCTPVAVVGTNPTSAQDDQCFIGFKSDSSDITEVTWSSTGTFDGTDHISWGKAGGSGGGCDLSPIEAKLDTEIRFTSDAELAVIEAKLDTETRFTSDAELAVIEGKLDDLAGDVGTVLGDLEDLKQGLCVSLDLMLTPHGTRCLDADDTICGVGDWGTGRGIEGIDTCSPGFTAGLTMDSVAADTGDGSRVRAGSGSAPTGYELRLYIGSALRNRQVDPLLIMPEREGGFFEEVAQLVKSTISFYRTYAEDPSALSKTESLVSDAERLEAEGNLVGAYKAYREAYQSLSGLLE